MLQRWGAGVALMAILGCVDQKLAAPSGPLQVTQLPACGESSISDAGGGRT
jgi:hypothetical protein